MNSKIFIVEDDNDLSKLVKEFLEKYSFDVYLCQDFKQVVPEIMQIRPDLNLLDINIPYFDGFY